VTDFAPGEPDRRRKPLRRTAWTLFVGGIVVAGLMIGVGLVLLAGGKDIGPGRPGVWPAGERASVHKHPGPQNAESQTTCEVIGADGEREYRWLEWAESARASTDVTVSCDGEAIFLTGTASSVASALQSPLILAPIAASMLGILLFFPRFTLAWARLSNPRPGPIRRWLGMRR
jgi:hypothetical protein